jgi:CBS-domain-containing membrane protein/PII-like signaling protein
MVSEMYIEKQALRLNIYIGESDNWHGKPLYSALLETLKAEGLAGATVTRGMAGFGAHSRIHTAAILRLSEDLPLHIQVIDSPEKIRAALETLAPMVREGLITLEPVEVVKYTHRYLNPLPVDRPVSEVMTRQVVTLTPDLPVDQAWRHMLEHLVKALPVVDQEGRPVGMLTDEDLIERAGLRTRLSMAKRLEPAFLEEELGSLQSSNLTVSGVMTHPVIAAKASEPLGVAVARMSKNGLKRLPVVDEEGKLAGVLSRFDILSLVSEVHPKLARHPHRVSATGTVKDVMSTRIPQVDREAGLPEIIAALLESNSHRLIVTDEDGLAIGLVNDADVVSRVHGTHRRGVLQALRLTGPTPPEKMTAGELMSPGALTVGAETPLVEAAAQMMAAGRKWMVVVDEQNHPLGLVDRQMLMRALTSG